MTVQEIMDFCKKADIEFSADEAQLWLDENPEAAAAPIEEFEKALAAVGTGELDDSDLDSVTGGIDLFSGSTSTAMSQLNYSAKLMLTNRLGETAKLQLHSSAKTLNYTSKLNNTNAAK